MKRWLLDLFAPSRNGHVPEADEILVSSPKIELPDPQTFALAAGTIELLADELATLIAPAVTAFVMQKVSQEVEEQHLIASLEAAMKQPQPHATGSTK